MANVIQVPRRDEIVLNPNGSMTLKFAIFLESLEVLETTTTINDAVSGAFGNLAYLQAFAARTSQNIASLEQNLSSNAGMIGQLFGKISRLTEDDLADIEHLVSSNSGLIGQLMALAPRTMKDIEEARQYAYIA